MAPEIEREFGFLMAKGRKVPATYLGHSQRVHGMQRVHAGMVLLLCLLALRPVVSGGAVFAQELPHPRDVRIQQMRVQVMPEFDDPLGALEPGQDVSIKVSYSRADPDPSALQEGKRPPETTAVEAPPGLQIPAEVFVFLAAALLILIDTFVGYQVRRGERAADEDSEDEADLFCRRCGTTLKADASHCHQCGAMVLQASINLEQATATSGWQSRERR